MEIAYNHPPASGHHSPMAHGAPGVFSLSPTTRFKSEDILFCVDVGPETMGEMKVNAPGGRPYTRLESIKQAIMMFVHSKITISSDHRFAFAALGKSTYWLRKEFNSDIDSALSALRGLSVESSAGPADLTQLFKASTHEAKKARAQNRNFRVILIYCRSSTPPQFQLPSSLKVLTLDVMYLHDKPSPENCPQKVYDTLVDALEQVSEYEGYICESGQGLMRSLLRHMSVLLSHPQQRCLQDELDVPKSLGRKQPALVESSSQGEDNNNNSNFVTIN